MSSFCSAKANHIFSAKNIRILCIESAIAVNEMTLNELVKLTTLWTTGPWPWICRLVWIFAGHTHPRSVFSCCGLNYLQNLWLSPLFNIFTLSLTRLCFMQVNITWITGTLINKKHLQKEDKRQRIVNDFFQYYNNLVLLNLDIPYLCKQCRSRSVGGSKHHFHRRTRLSSNNSFFSSFRHITL